MKVIGRILIILVVFSIVSGLLVTVVNASGLNARAVDDSAQFRPSGGEDGFKPEGAENRPERGERGGGVSRLMFGAIKNVVVIGFLVTVIAWPKSVVKKKKKNAAVISASGKL